MFAQTISVSMKCPTHPAFTPELEEPLKKCQSCQTITHVYAWMKLINRSHDKFVAGGYSSSDIPDKPLPTVEDLADVAEEVETRSSEPATKRAVATMVNKAPEKIRNVKRKG